MLWAKGLVKKTEYIASDFKKDVTSLLRFYENVNRPSEEDIKKWK